MKKIELNIPPQYLYFILITIFVVTFFGIILYVSSGEEGSAAGLPSPSPANFLEVLSAQTKNNNQLQNKPYSGIGPNPNEKYIPTPSPTGGPTPTPTVSPTPILIPTPTPTSEPTPSPTSVQISNPTPSPTPTPTSSPTSSPTPSPTPSPIPSPT